LVSVARAPIVDRHTIFGGRARFREAGCGVEFRRRKDEHPFDALEGGGQRVRIVHPRDGDIAAQRGPRVRALRVARHGADCAARGEQCAGDGAADFSSDSSNGIHGEYSLR
jgi:hypothetical protein